MYIQYLDVDYKYCYETGKANVRMISFFHRRSCFTRCVFFLTDVILILLFALPSKILEHFNLSDDLQDQLNLDLLSRVPLLRKPDERKGSFLQKKNQKNNNNNKHFDSFVVRQAATFTKLD